MKNDGLKLLITTIGVACTLAVLAIVIEKRFFPYKIVSMEIACFSC